MINLNELPIEKKQKIGKKIAEGAFADVHEVDGEELVVKIGQTKHWIPPLSEQFRLPIPRKPISNIMKFALGKKYKIHPDEEHILEGLEEYNLLHSYYGSENRDNSITIKNREKLITSLKNPTDSFHKAIKKIVSRDQLIATIIQTLEAHQNENFLPAEEVFIGTPPDTQDEKEKSKTTYYLFQKAITGEHILPLHKFTHHYYEDHKLLVERLLVFSILTKKMYFDTGAFIDARPNEVAKHITNWFQKTANILVDTKHQKVYFIDTRWLWQTKNTKILGTIWVRIMQKLGNRSLNKAIKLYSEEVIKFSS